MGLFVLDLFVMAAVTVPLELCTTAFYGWSGIIVGGVAVIFANMLAMMTA